MKKLLEQLEDKELGPTTAGADYMGSIDFAVYDFKKKIREKTSKSISTGQKRADISKEFEEILNDTTMYLALALQKVAKEFIQMVRKEGVESL